MGMIMVMMEVMDTHTVRLQYGEEFVCWQPFYCFTCLK